MPKVDLRSELAFHFNSEMGAENHAWFLMDMESMEFKTNGSKNEPKCTTRSSSDELMHIKFLFMYY